MSASLEPNPLPLFMFPGLNGETWIFDRLREQLPQLQPLPWLQPQPGEPLAQYAARLAESFRVLGPCFVGGVSFGGIVALEVAKLINAPACFVISSIADTCELPRWQRATRYLGQRNLERGLTWISFIVAHLPRFLSGSWAATLRRLSPEQRAWRHWAFAAVACWRNLPGNKPMTPMHRLHGKFDTTFPIAKAFDTQIVATAGHLLIVTHPQVVVDFLDRGMNSSRYDNH